MCCSWTELPRQVLQNQAGAALTTRPLKAVPSSSTAAAAERLSLCRNIVDGSKAALSRWRTLAIAPRLISTPNN